MIYLGIALAVCVILLIVVWVRLLLIKREMRNLTNALMTTRDRENNMQLTVEMVDMDLQKLTTEINNNLDYQKQTKLDMEQTERRLKESISDIAHDLRTPITVIKGNLQLLERSDISEENAEYVRISEQKIDTLKTMVDDFFEMSVLESDDREVSLERVDMTKLLMEFVLDHESVIRGAGLTPEIELPEKSIFVMANPDMVNRMFSNILNNTVKYAQTGFKISLSEDSKETDSDGNETKTSGCTITFSNWIDKRTHIDVDQLFERTYRADKARKDGSAGLGLYIVKLLAKKQNASVRAAREPERLSILIEW